MELHLLQLIMQSQTVAFGQKAFFSRPKRNAIVNFALPDICSGLFYSSWNPKIIRIRRNSFTNGKLKPLFIRLALSLCEGKAIHDHPVHSTSAKVCAQYERLQRSLTLCKQTVAGGGLSSWLYLRFCIFSFVIKKLTSKHGWWYKESNDFFVCRSDF